MRSPFVAFLLSIPLVACSSSSGDGSHLGDACDATKLCGDGAVCDMTATQGPVCVDADGDDDNDGLANSVDFCQHMAGGKYDEDGDGIGDDCDACPIAKPPATPDKDSDGVDSPCDPNPDTDGEKIVLFNGFNDGAFPTGWKASATWQVRGGAAIMTPTDAATVSTVSVPLGSATSHTVVMTGYRIDSVATGATAVDAAVFGLSNLPMSPAVTADCGGSRIGTDDALRLQTDAGSNAKPFMNLFDPAGAYRIVEQLDGVNAACAVVGPVQSGAITTVTNGNPVTEAGMFARGATTRFSYLLVVQR